MHLRTNPLGQRSVPVRRVPNQESADSFARLQRFPVLPQPINKTIDRSLPIMAETLGYYAGARPGTTDADILDRIEEQFGSWLQGLTRDDKATVLICLVERVTDPQQVFIQENFFSNANGGEL